MGGVPMKRADECVRGLLVKIGRRGVLLDAPVAEQDDLVGHAHGLGLIVGDIDHGDAQRALRRRISWRIS